MDAAQLRAQAALYFEKARELGSTREGIDARFMAQEFLQRARAKEEADRYLIK
jgi:hypothetical protein